MEPNPSPYAALLLRNERRARAAACRVAAERLGAESEFELLLSLGDDEARQRVASARRRFRSPVLAQQLLEASRHALVERPRRARHLADLAYRVVLFPNRRSSFTVELMVTALLYRAQAEALLGDLATAELGFTLARRLRCGLPITDLVLRAEMDLFEGLLCRRRRRYHRADRLLLRAWRLFRLGGSRQQAVEALLEFACSRRQQGDATGALEALRRCRRLATSVPRPLAARCEVALLETLAALGRWPQLAAALPRVRALCSSDPGLEGRISRLGGRLASQRGSPAVAERALLTCWGKLRRGGEALEAALACLDLAEHYLRHDRPNRGRRATERCLSTLLAVDLPAEAHLAVRSLQAREPLTGHHVAQARGALDRLRDAPRPAIPPS